MSTFTILFLCNILICVNSIQQNCCDGENVLVNGTCISGDEVLNIPCNRTKMLRIPSKEKPNFHYETDGTLIATDAYDMGYIRIDSRKYCSVEEFERNMTVIYACTERNQVTYPTMRANILSIIKSVCAFITVLFLLPVLVIYSFIPAIHDLEGKCILNFTLCLCIAHLVIIFLPLIRYFEPHICNTTTFIYYTAIVCCYNWLVVLSFHLWRITLKPAFRTHMQWLIVYVCYGYGLPLILLVTALVLYYTLKHNVMQPEDQCWVDGSMLVWTYFYGPTLIMVLISAVLQYFAAKRVWKEMRYIDSLLTLFTLRKKSLRYSHLLLVMGQAKIIDVMAYAYFQEQPSTLNYLWQFADCRNLLIGGVVLFIFVILRDRVLKAMAEENVPCIKFPERWRRLIDEEEEEMEKLRKLMLHDMDKY